MLHPNVARNATDRVERQKERKAQAAVKTSRQLIRYGMLQSYSHNYTEDACYDRGAPKVCGAPRFSNLYTSTKTER